MANSFLQSLPDARRIRTSLLRLPLCTRGLVAVITLLYVVHWFVPEITEWGALIPSKINLSTLHRLNTFPLLHRDIFHYLLNIIALTPLLERFESEHGTVVTFILFTGPFGLIPGLLYTILERFIFRLDGHAVGSSIWVFLLLSNEAIKQYRQNPYFQISDFKIPTWTTPLILIMVINFLIPHTSLLGHLCGAAVGYLWGLGYIKFLAPPDKILRWIEGKLNLLGRLPHYVSVDQKTYGRYGVLPSNGGSRVGPGRGTLGAVNGVAVGPLGTSAYGTFWTAIIHDRAPPNEPPQISVDLVEEKNQPASSSDPPPSDVPSAATSVDTFPDTAPSRNRASSMVVRPTRPTAVQRSTTNI